MPFSATSRFFIEFEVMFRAAHDRGKSMHLIDETKSKPDVLGALTKAVRNDTAKILMSVSDELELLRVRKVVGSQIVALLFKRADPNIPPHIYAHRTNKSLRKSEKFGDEDVAFSAHFFILNENIGTVDLPKYRAFLEEVPGIAKSQVLLLLKKIISDEKYVYENNKAQEKETHTVVDMLGVPNAALGDAVIGGRIPRITLIRQAVVDGLDTEGETVRPREQRMSMTLKAVPDPIGLVRRIKTWARTKGWTDFRVDVVMAENRTRTVSMARDDEAASALLIRAIPISLSRPVDSCVHQIVPEMVEHARILFGI